VITETPILTELFYPIRVEKLRCNKKFRDHGLDPSTLAGITATSAERRSKRAEAANSEQGQPAPVRL
jgi:hypothetical protein